MKNIFRKTARAESESVFLWSRIVIRKETNANPFKIIWIGNPAAGGRVTQDPRQAHAAPAHLLLLTRLLLRGQDVSGKQCSGSEIINCGSGSSSGKSSISDLDPDPGKYPITDPDPDPTSELQIDKNTSKFSKIREKIEIFWT